MIWIAIVAGSLFLAEFYGYCLHIFLHSYCIPALSRAHMNHHVLSYPPGSRMRFPDYKQEVDGDILIFGLGLEWILPSIVLMAFTVGVEWLIGMSWLQIGVSIGTILIYVVFLFWFLHEILHLRNHKLLDNKFIRGQILRARKLHDIHHHHVDDNGLMNRNYGIAFFMFDKFFGTFLPVLRGGINTHGVAAAKERLKEKT